MTPASRSPISSIPTDAGLAAAGSANIKSVMVRDYWPQPQINTVHINEFYLNGQPYSVERYVNAGNGTYYLEDFQLTSSGQIFWWDTWNYEIRADGSVLEIMDSMVDLNAPQTWSDACRASADNCALTDQRLHPMNHGNLLTIGSWFGSQASGISYALTIANGTATIGSALGQFYNYFSMNPIDVKAYVDLPAGRFNNVLVQNEQQVVATGATTSTVNYRFYYAPGSGIIAQQWYGSDWKPLVGSDGRPLGLIYLQKSCDAPATQYRCSQ